MSRLALLITAALASCQPAYANGHLTDWDAIDTHSPEVYYDHTQDGASFGRIVHYNQQTTATTIEELEIETARGIVKLKINRTKNNECARACPDTLEVIDVPAGVVAVPFIISTEEGLVGSIKLYIYEGS
jgi:hypothetical protein